MSDSGVAITPGLGASIAVEVQGGLDYQVILQGRHLASPYSEVAINIAGNGDNLLVAASGTKIGRVYGFFLASAGFVNVKWKDIVNAADFHPAIPLLGNGAFWFMPRDGNPWFTTAASGSIGLNLSGAVQVSGRLYYGLD